MLIVSTFLTPAGWLEVAYDEHYIYTALFIENKDNKPIKPRGELGLLINEQLHAYSQQPHHRFELPLKPEGTSYQLTVWNALLVIPSGRTLSYGEFANTLQSSPRAIGQACKKNPLALFIPCHRIVGKNNQGGYMGRADAVNYKLALLKHERLT
jgi:methylated-DNA-[protein]-cysteine S-methyltransferase